MPDCLKPPNGVPRKCLPTSLIHTNPASTAAAVRCAVEMSLVQIDAVRPYSTEFTSSSIVASFDHLRMPSTGPKISSCAMRIDIFTSANTVGSQYKPLASAGSLGGPPPQSSRAPSCLAESM